MWLVVDTNVLVDASGGQGVKEYAAASHNLLRALADIPSFILALDCKQKILCEYQARIRAPMFAYQWLERLRLGMRIKRVNGSGIPRGPAVQLQEAHFDIKDYKLVDAALYASKIIVTRDFKSFTNSVQTILRRKLDIRVMSAPDTFDWLAGGGVLPEHHDEDQS